MRIAASTRGPRRGLDALIVFAVRGLGAVALLPGARSLFALGGALAASLLWPMSSLRRRSRRVGLSVSPFAWGARQGAHLWCLLRGEGLGARRERGVLEPGLILAAHLGPWEAGAVALAERGLRPHVLAAPWPRLPRTEALLAELRARAGVRSLPRDRAGWRAATRQLRSGGTVVVLIDSANPRRPGRRALPFVDGSIAAPDALVRWARRRGAPVWLAVGSDGGFDLQPLSMADAADVAVSTLAEAVRREPSSWAWAHALAALVFSLLPACAPPDVPPLPTDPASWVAEAEGVTWQGRLDEGWSATLSATRAEGRWVDGRIDGQFDTLIVGLLPDGADVPIAVATARTAEGAWPRGPLRMQDAAWDIDGRAEGRAPTITWLGGARWSCGGCPLEALAAEVESRGLGALQDSP